VIPTDYRKEVSSVIEINGERYYTRKETAKLLNVSLPTLTRWKRKGILVPVKISPRKVFYREEDIKKLLRKRE